MKSQFTTSWKASIQPRKQRKYIDNAPFHIKHKFLSSHLSKILRQKYGKRSVPVRKGDEVLVMRGSFKKKRAKVTSVDLKNNVVTLEGIQRSKKDGTKVNVYFKPHILSIQTLSLEDRKRTVALERKSKSSTPTSKSTSQSKTVSKTTTQTPVAIKPIQAKPLPKTQIQQKGEQKNASN